MSAAVATELGDDADSHIAVGAGAGAGAGVRLDELDVCWLNCLYCSSALHAWVHRRCPDCAQSGSVGGGYVV